MKSNEKLALKAQVLRSKEQQNSGDPANVAAVEGGFCVACPSELSNSYLQLQPCNHKLCYQCAFKCFSFTEPEEFCCQCPSCNSDIETNVQVHGGEASDPVPHLYYDKYKHAHKEKDAFRSFVASHEGNIESKGFLQLVIGGTGDSAHFYTVEFDQSTDGFGTVYKPERNKRLLDIGCLLHHFIYNEGYTKTYHNSLSETKSLKDFQDKAFSDERAGSIPFRFFYSLVTGTMADTYPSEEARKGMKNKKELGRAASDFLSVAVAYDYMMRHGENKPSCMMNLLGEAVYKYSRSHPLIELLSPFRLSVSWNTLVRRGEQNIGTAGARK